MPVNCYQTKLFQMHHCAMAFQSEMAFWPEMTFRPEIVFWPEKAFRQWIRMELISYILARMPSKSEIPFFARNGFLARIGFLARNGFSDKNGFLAVLAVQQKLHFGQKYFCQIWSGFLARNVFIQINLLYFSKYWKVWLKAFRLVFKQFLQNMAHTLINF